MLDRSPFPRLFDGALAVLVTAIGVAEIWLPFSSVQGEGSRTTSTLVVILLGLPLALRRVEPLATAVVVLFIWPVVLAEMEREVLRERTLDGLAAARRRGKRGGRPPATSPAQRQESLRMRNEGRSLNEIAAILGCSERTVRRVLAVEEG